MDNLCDGQGLNVKKGQQGENPPSLNTNWVKRTKTSSELQIRRGIEDNSMIIFLISHCKHML